MPIGSFLPLAKELALIFWFKAALNILFILKFISWLHVLWKVVLSQFMTTQWSIQWLKKQTFSSGVGGNQNRARRRVSVGFSLVVVAGNSSSNDANASTVSSALYHLFALYHFNYNHDVYLKVKGHNNFISGSKRTFHSELEIDTACHWVCISRSVISICWSKTSQRGRQTCHQTCVWLEGAQLSLS